MVNFDIFNGDADGILSLLQLRKAFPKLSVKITGVKRDIALLQQCQAQHGDQVTVLDISLEKNIEPLKSMLKNHVAVFYADHHRAGEIPDSPNLEAHINLSPEMCTCLIINEWLSSQYIDWAITGAYGDNLIKKADELCQQHGISPENSQFLRELGTLINYNGYGASVDDLHYHPADLYDVLMQYNTPYELRDDQASPYYVLQREFEKDMRVVESISPYFTNEIMTVTLLPNEPASRRASGVLGNKMSNAAASKAQLILTPNQSLAQDDVTFTVSLRAPQNNKIGADEICKNFVSGGGRAGAAGINHLPYSEINRLIAAVQNFYG